MAFNYTVASSYQGPYDNSRQVLNQDAANSAYLQFGTASNRPTAGNRGVMYYATDTESLVYDTGSTWQTVSTGDEAPITFPLTFGTVANRAATKPTGSLYYATDTKQLFYRTSSSWVSMADFDRLIPSGGTTGQVLSKSANGNYQLTWNSLPDDELPAGGSTGQVLQKSSGTDGDVEWATLASSHTSGQTHLPSGGTSGQLLKKDSATDGDTSWFTPSYSASNHSHSGFSSSNHSHSGFASSSHNHNSTYASISGGGTIHISNSAPTAGDGSNGDIWLEY